MTELDLYKFINDNDIEYHWEINENKQSDVLILPHPRYLKELNDLLSPGIFDDEGIQITWKDGYLAIWMGEICDYYDIDMSKVFDKKHNR